MNIVNVLFPVVVDDFTAYPAVVAHYRESLGLPLKAEFEHDGFTVSWLGPMVVLGAPDAAALEIPRQVDAIFLVDDLDAFWFKLSSKNEVLVHPKAAPTGRRFILRHTEGDRRVVEYLQLAA